jgi:hypothetical protein
MLILSGFTAPPGFDPRSTILSQGRERSAVSWPKVEAAYTTFPKRDKPSGVVENGKNGESELAMVE